MLPKIDRRILKLLQDDGRLSYAEIARQVRLSPSACFEHIKRLRNEGYITGFTAVLDPARLDQALLIFVEIVLDRTTPDVFDAFAQAIKRMPEVQECHMVAGGFDYLIKARVKDMTAYRTFLGESLTRLPGVRQTHTYAVMEEVKNSMRLSL
jgi:Lrp/AsnC family transcriptional regulator, leucine-responsive regulatory protein